MTASLSTFLPANTAYFYGYPAGEDSSFYNLVPPPVEELVSARPLVCAGENIDIVAFAGATRTETLSLLRDLGVPLVAESQIIRLPEEIGIDLLGAERNRRVINALCEKTRNNSLLMAQPYNRRELDKKYQIESDVSTYMNDKARMYDYIPNEYLPELLATFQSGCAFAQDERKFAPCVVKVSSSSSGDGVRICRNERALTEAKKSFSTVQGTILIQALVTAQRNIGIQFGIPADSAKPIEILGLSRQVTTSDGEFMGGVVKTDDKVPDLIRTVLEKTILPKVRSRGWYGVGGLDVLVDNNNRIFFIDPNYRITAMTAYVYEMLAGVVKRNMLTMTAAFNGSTARLKTLASADESSQLLNLIALRGKEGGYQFNGGLLFEDISALRKNARLLLEAGVTSDVLRAIEQQSDSILIPDLE